MEKDLHKTVLRFLSLMGIPVGVARMDKPSTMPKGWPDMTFPYHGYFVAWELKADKGKPSAEQIQYGHQIIAKGGQWRIIRSLEECQYHLRELDIMKKNEILANK